MFKMFKLAIAIIAFAVGALLLLVVPQMVVTMYANIPQNTNQEIKTINAISDTKDNLDTWQNIFSDFGKWIRVLK